MIHDTREQWLAEAVALISGRVFKQAGVEELSGKWRIGCSWPGGGSARKSIGECWPSRASADGTREMFISPTLDDPAKVLPVVVHEMIHAIDDCASGHRGRFARDAEAVGLEGKMTETHAGMDLSKELVKISHDLGDYPHSKLVMALSGKKKQSTRLIKLSCSRCGFIARASKTALEQAGLPTCGCGGNLEASDN